MQRIIVVVLSIVLLTAIARVPHVAYAESPQPVQYAIAQCSGLSIDLVVSAQQSFDSAYGWAHQLTTPEQWQATYVARVNEFAHAVGCPDVLVQNADGSAALTFSARIYAPIFQAIYTHAAFPY